MVPVRPTNMSAMRTYFPASGSSGVMPVDRPTVANAEMVSKRMTSSVSPVISSRSRLDRSTAVAPTNDTATASRRVSRGMRRPNASMSRSPRASDTMAMSMTASVVTLMPPAVDAEPPPTNISASVMSQLASCMPPVSTVEKPPERGMTPAKSDARSFSPSPRGLRVRWFPTRRRRRAPSPRRRAPRSS